MQGAQVTFTKAPQPNPPLADPIVQFQGRGRGRGGRGRGGSTRGSYRQTDNNGGQDNHQGNANGDGTGTKEKP